MTGNRVTFTMEPGSTTGSIEMGIDFVDRGPDGSEGYRVTVGWSDDDDAWIARLHGLDVSTSATGHGDTKEEALCHLACSLALLADVLHDELHPREPDERT